MKHETLKIRNSKMGPINAAEVRLSALRHEIAEVEKKIKKAEKETE